MNKIAIALISVIITGCAATPLNPAAQKVRISLSEPGKECKFLGDVTGSQGDFFTGAYTSNEDLETGARNTLKNKAAEMGGNFVAMLTQRAGQTGSYGEYGGSSSQTNVTLTGNVYSCPE